MTAAVIDLAARRQRSATSDHFDRLMELMDMAMARGNWEMLRTAAEGLITLEEEQKQCRAS